MSSSHLSKVSGNPRRCQRAWKSWWSPPASRRRSSPICGPEAQKYIKLLKFDPQHPSSKQPLTVYSYATVNVNSYPNLIKEPFTTIVAGAYLVTYDFNMRYTVNHLVRFGRSPCQNFSVLQEKGHPKWREADLSLPALGPGWSYYEPTTRAIRACMGRVGAAPAPKPSKACTPEERILGLCR